MTDIFNLVSKSAPQGQMYGIVIEKDAGKELANVLVPALLFGLLSPGSFLHIPPKETGPYAGQYITPGLTDWRAVLVHTLVFALIYYLIRLVVPSWF